MKTNVSKAQLEVWEWKDRIYEITKNLTRQQRIELMKKQTESLLLYLKGVKKNEID